MGILVVVVVIVSGQAVGSSGRMCIGNNEGGSVE